jgi:hypothetical protein
VGDAPDGDGPGEVVVVEVAEDGDGLGVGDLTGGGVPLVRDGLGDGVRIEAYPVGLATGVGLVIGLTDPAGTGTGPTTR